MASYELNIEESEALATENEMTPRSIRIIAPIFSAEVPPELFTYPTVVIVVIVMGRKCNAKAYQTTGDKWKIVYIVLK